VTKAKNLALDGLLSVTSGDPTLVILFDPPGVIRVLFDKIFTLNRSGLLPAGKLLLCRVVSDIGVTACSI